MENKETEISIIIPVHNAADYIRETVNSVLRQTVRNYELLLVEDGSTDKTPQILRSFTDERIRVLTNPAPHKACFARNFGIREAKGRYITFLDADDLWDKEKLRKTLDFMRQHQAAFVFTAYEFGDAAGKGTGRIVHVPLRLEYKQALSRTIIFTSTVMFDMKKLTKDEIFMPEIKSEDTATWWRLLRNGISAWGLNESLVIYRRAGKSLSSNKLEAIRRIWNLYRKWEGLTIPQSLYYFFGWAFRAVVRRL